MSSESHIVCNSVLVGLRCEKCNNGTPCDLALAQKAKRDDDALRADNKPTLKVTFGDLLKRKR